MLTPYDYQVEAVDSIFRFLEENAEGNPIVGMPTGTGKSVIIAEFLKKLYMLYPSIRVLVVTHVKELVGQNHAELLEQWPTAPAGIYSAGLKRKEKHFPITFCGIASIAKQLSYFTPIHIVLIDECHLLSDKDETMYQRTLAELKACVPRMRVVGFTATPYRLGMGLLTEGKIFSAMCIDYTSYEKFNELLDAGYMCPLIPAKTDVELDTTNVAIQGGDFVLSELAAAVDVESITRAALEESVRIGWGRRHWLVFCVSIEHAEHACEILRSMGIPAVTVHSKMPSLEVSLAYLRTLGVPESRIRWYISQKMTSRDVNIQAFKDGYVGAMVGMGVFTTGFNFKPVDFIIVLRPTKSAILWVQLLGRGTRTVFAPGFDLTTAEGRRTAIFTSQKPNCLVADFAANTRTLGPINDPKIPRKKGKKGSDMVPYKICPHCNTYNHTRARFCIRCQAEFPVHVALSDQASQDELIRRSKKIEPPPVSFETFTVTSIHASKHKSRDPSKPPALLISYYCGRHVFNEYLCLEHESQYARKKARDTWRAFSSRGVFDDTIEDPPDSVDEALPRFPALPKPVAIRVLLREKYPEVVGHDFDTLRESDLELNFDAETGAFIPTEDTPF